MEINEEKLKGILKEHKEDTDAKIDGIKGHFDTVLKEQEEKYQRYLGVVAEDFSSQIKLLAESVSGIQEQLIALREMVAKNTKDIEIMKIDIAFIKNGMKKKVDTEEFEALETRVAILEAKPTA